ncbi:MAG TPA: helix-turn-helix domain-containing protein [Myxococcota bacterium]|nr:helix-turn-helix domain-containing protein [Myxococcota bacterium]
MVRPRQFDPAAVDAALLGVFWARGYARASIEEIADATGLLRGSLYAAYGSKEDMFRAAVRRYVADLAAALATERRGLGALEHVLETVVRLTVEDPERRGCVILNAVPEAHALSGKTRAELARALESMPALLRARLREAAADAGAALELEPLVALLFAATVSIRVLGRAGMDSGLLRDIARGAIEAARRGVTHADRPDRTPTTQ